VRRAAAPRARDAEAEAREDLYYVLTWPAVSYVAVDGAGRVVGYILGKMCVCAPAPRTRR
jgi:hypothetical protein